MDNIRSEGIEKITLNDKKATESNMKILEDKKD